MSQDIFDINWKAFANSKKGKYYTKKNDDRFNCYEKHIVEYIENSKKIYIEVYIQLIPPRGAGPFLERNTTLRIILLEPSLDKLEVVPKTFFKQLFNKKESIKVNESNFDRKYLVISTPKTQAEKIFSNSQFITDLISLKLKNIELQQNYEEKGFVIVVEFPDILFKKEDINTIDQVIKHLIQYL